MKRHTSRGALLDKVRAGDYLFVTYQNLDGSHSAVVSGPALAAPDVDPAVGVDTLTGDPHVIRSTRGEIWGDIIFLQIIRDSELIGYYGETE